MISAYSFKCKASAVDTGARSHTHTHTHNGAFPYASYLCSIALGRKRQTRSVPRESVAIGRANAIHYTCLQLFHAYCLCCIDIYSEYISMLCCRCTLPCICQPLWFGESCWRLQYYVYVHVLRFWFEKIHIDFALKLYYIAIYHTHIYFYTCALRIQCTIAHYTYFIIAACR